MTTDNTQELDEIIGTHMGSGEIFPRMSKKEAKQAILDWHNKQVESELKSIYSELGHIKAVRDCIDDRQAERVRLRGGDGK